MNTGTQPNQSIVRGRAVTRRVVGQLANYLGIADERESANQAHPTTARPCEETAATPPERAKSALLAGVAFGALVKGVTDLLGTGVPLWLSLPLGIAEAGLALTWVWLVLLQRRHRRESAGSLSGGR